MQSWTSAFGKILSIASGKPFKPSIQAIRISLTPKSDREIVRGNGGILLKLLSDPFAEIRTEAIAHISLRCFPEATVLMIKRLKDPYSIIRLHAARQLGLLEFIPEMEVMKVQSALEAALENEPVPLVYNALIMSLDLIRASSETNKMEPSIRDSMLEVTF